VGHPARAGHEEHGAHRRDGYARRRPEEGVLYQTVAARWPAFRERMEQLGGLPKFVVREFEEYLLALGPASAARIRPRALREGRERLRAPKGLTRQQWTRPSRESAQAKVVETAIFEGPEAPRPGVGRARWFQHRGETLAGSRPQQKDRPVVPRSGCPQSLGHQAVLLDLDAVVGAERAVRSVEIPAIRRVIHQVNSEPCGSHGKGDAAWSLVHPAPVVRVEFVDEEGRLVGDREEGAPDP